MEGEIGLGLSHVCMYMRCDFWAKLGLLGFDILGDRPYNCLEKSINGGEHFNTTTSENRSFSYVVV